MITLEESSYLRQFDFEHLPEKEICNLLLSSAFIGAVAIFGIGTEVTEIYNRDVPSGLWLMSGLVIGLVSRLRRVSQNLSPDKRRALMISLSDDHEDSMFDPPISAVVTTVTTHNEHGLDLFSDSSFRVK